MNWLDTIKEYKVNIIYWTIQFVGWSYWMVSWPFYLLPQTGLLIGFAISFCDLWLMSRLKAKDRKYQLKWTDFWPDWRNTPNKKDN